MTPQELQQAAIAYLGKVFTSDTPESAPSQVVQAAVSIVLTDFKSLASQTKAQK